ncbi:hypothetical protein ABT403_37495 [Streptomyces sp. NPDC000075]|uniref:hypothetical protein n=1 Tax=Streptomyces TaxID=1883 RepID=UPI0031D9A3B6
MPLVRGVYWNNQPHLLELQALGRTVGPRPGPGRCAAPPEALAERARHAAWSS